MIDSERLEYLINKISINNDERAFDELLHNYFPGLLSFATSIIKDRHFAEEIVEDVFVKIWEIRGSLPGIKNLSHYLYISTKHACINFLQSKQFIKSKKSIVFHNIESDFLFSFNTPETKLISGENLKKISDVIDTLPPACRLIFRLIKEDGLKYKEVAELLDISPKTVNTQMTRAMAKIIGKLQELFPDYNSTPSRENNQNTN